MCDILQKLGVSERAQQRFEQYYRLLDEYNQKFNLTALSTRGEIYVKHFADSILPKELIKQGASVIDVGSGAGFPAVPLKIVRDDLSVLCVDSLQKRVGFLDVLIQALQLTGISARHSRAEELRCFGEFDVGVARAVAKLNTLAELVLPFVRVGGIMLAYKSADIDEEIKQAQSAVAALGARIESVREIPLLDTGITRKFVVIKKVAATPKGYPRGKNLPRKSPL